LQNRSIVLEKSDILTLSTQAMNTTFEVALWGKDQAYLQSAAEEALAEITRLEQQLSFYRSDSDITDLNAHAWRRPIPVDPRLFYLLKRAKELWEETGGAFDVTVAPLMKAWGMAGGLGRVPIDEEIEAALQVTGMGLVELNKDEFTVHFLREGVLIDLGAIGKGYAIEQAAEILRDAEMPGALIHGGTSTVQAIGTRPDGTPWNVAIQHPTEPDGKLAIVPLVDNALSVSAVHGKFFTEGEQRFGHVIDPRTGRPVQSALLAVVVCESATNSDALSTALLTRGPEYLDALCATDSFRSGLVAIQGNQGAVTVHTRGSFE
jgi:thiamine biosynthesis lipoprotein